MKTYSVSYKYSRDGKSWTSTSTSVKAESDMGAITQIQTKYTYIKDVRIVSVR